MFDPLITWGNLCLLGASWEALPQGSKDSWKRLQCYIQTTQWANSLVFFIHTLEFVMTTMAKMTSLEEKRWLQKNILPDVWCDWVSIKLLVG